MINVWGVELSLMILSVNVSGQHARVAAIRTAGFMKKVDIIIAKIAIIQLIQDIIRKRKP